MVDIKKMASSPSVFQRQYGVSYGVFCILLKQVENHVQAKKQQRPITMRGRKSGLALQQQVLLTLTYLRQYITFLNLGIQFNISESYAQKRFVYIRNILIQELHLPAHQALSLHTLTLAVSMDVSEQPIERPQKDQKEYYSGKKKTQR